MPQPVAGSTLVHFNLGLALRQKGYHKEALREYRLALEAGEDRRLNLQAMAEVHLLRRELGAALELYETLVRDYPDSPKLWNERGVCLHQAGRRAEAVVSYERAVGIDSAYQLAWNNLGVVRAHEAKPDAAIAAFRQALGADRPCWRPGSTSACSPSSGASSGPRWRSTSRRWRSSPAAPSPGTASAWC